MKVSVDNFVRAETARMMTNLMTAGNGNEPWSGAVRPLDGQLDEPSLGMLGLYVLLPILAAESAHHRHTHAP